jgi:antitoxin MazE
MLTRIEKRGNGQGVRIAQQVLENAALAVGDAVDVAVRDGVIVVAPAKGMRGKHDLRELVARIHYGYRAKEVNRSKPVGRETW